MAAWRKHLIASAFCFSGTAAVIALVLTMNGAALEREDAADAGVVKFSVAPPPKKPPARKAEPKSKPKKTNRNPPPPAPMVGAGLSGLAFGLDALQGGGMGNDVSALLGDVHDVVMTEDAVDGAPRPLPPLAQPEYPERARKKGVTGVVKLSLLVGLDGRVQDARVLESEPAGVFDAPALAAVRQWRFEPATYEGRAVAVRVTQALRFGFRD